MAHIIGTAGSDVLNDTLNEDLIEGLDGDDTITSRYSFDTILGGGGNDRILVSRDLTNAFGPITVDGGMGDDFITIGELHQYSAVVAGGTGADRIEVDTISGQAAIDAGANDDRIIITDHGSQSVAIGLTTGAGSDLIEFRLETQINASKVQLTIEDFTAGVGGDRIDFGSYVLLFGPTNPNPFGTGHFFLAQQGADTVLYVDFDGAGPATLLNPLITFENLALGTLTAWNFFGYPPDGSPPAALAITGGAGNETLNGEAGDDVIHGGGGADSIDGRNGSDVIHGEAGDDILVDYVGVSAHLYGGDGNDTLIVHRILESWLSGGGVVDGGAGDDMIDVHAATAQVTILGGTGNDTFRVGLGAPVIDAGADNDTIVMTTFYHAMTLGSGIDTIRYEGFGRATVEDFQAGAGGDVIHITSALLVSGVTGWDYHTNPFDTDHVSLVQQGANVAVRIDLNGFGTANGGSAREIALLENLTVAQLTAHNFGGWDPNGGQPAGMVLTGTPGPDTLTGGDFADTISGLGGDDVIRGGVSNDQIDGGDGDDEIDGEHGSDTVDGGTGNDVITDSIDGNDTLRGGAGDDILTLTRAQTRFQHGPSTVVLEGGGDDDVINVIGSGLQNGEYIDATISGGTGNDTVNIGALRSGAIDMGDGGDQVVINSIAQLGYAEITLGTGGDVITFYRPILPGIVNVLDFEVGDSGDRLEFLGGWYPISFAQDGNNVRVIETIGDTNPVVRWVMTLLDVQASQLSYHNTGFPRNGTSGPDQIFGTPNIDVINGLDGNDFIYGYASNDRLNGGGGNDFIDGGSGNDEMTGGTGNDIFYVDSVGDSIAEVQGGGTDTVYASLSYTLGTGVFAEILSTVSHGATTAIDLTGNSFNNTLVGNAGANVLNGGGGNDELQGLGGNDTYFVDAAGARVIEAANAGRDVVYASVNHTLGANQSVEVLSTRAHAGTTAINLTGNNLAQEVWGNAGANTLDGGGGSDYLLGLGGNDTYLVDVAGARVIEAASAGFDVVYASVSYTLGANQSVEVLSTRAHAGTTAINLTGNNLAQEIWGNAGNNVIRGAGGTDSLVGLGGNDTYIVENLGVRVFEAAGGGTRDAVYSAVDYILGSGQDIEVLSALSHASTTALSLTGNAVSNEIWGNAGANTIDGKGGNDTLAGLGGADTFAFTTAPGAGNVDLVLNYSVADDTIALDDAVFAGLVLGALNPNAFHTGAAAADASDRIIYNNATGQLFFDADGSGAGAQTQFATLATGLALAAGDFVVI